MTSVQHPSRTKRLYVRFTTDELTAATTRAAAVGRPVAVYLRDAALRTAPKARPGHQIEELVHQLARATIALQALSQADPATVPQAPTNAPLSETVLREARAVLQRAAELMERRP